MYKIKFDLPNLAKGAEFDVWGLGRFQNGHEYEIDKEAAERFREAGQVVKTETDEDGNMHVDVQPGPTLLEAFKNDDNVKVEAFTPKAEGKSTASKTEGDDK